jgi:hypothetical protein
MMNEAAPPPKPGLGIWLLKQACELREAINALTKDVMGDREETKRLGKAVDDLIVQAEQSAKVQATTAIELVKIKLAAAETQRQLTGLKIAKGIFKAKAQKILKGMEGRLN